MKIRFVLCHRSDDLSGEFRQIFLAARMHALGHDTAIYAMSLHSEHAVLTMSNDGVAISFFPPDSLQVSPHDTLSDALLQALKDDDPDVIVVKGVDYLIANVIFSVFPGQKLVVIIGGVSDHPQLSQCRLIFFETRNQCDRYKGLATTSTLPKFIPWEEIVEHAETSDFDIVNVGNFDEDRKAQELLFPFIMKTRVLLIGDGRRLEGFRAICRDKPNVTMPGFVSSRVLFQYLSKSSLMVHCSTWDGYPRAVAEGLAAGIPVMGLNGVLDGIADAPLIRTAPLEKLHSMVFEALERPEELATVGRKAVEYMRSTSTSDILSGVFQEGLARAFGLP